MKSIRQHLTASLLGVFALLLGGGSVLIYLSERVALYRELDARLQVNALAMAALTKPGRNEVEFEYPRRMDTAGGRGTVAEYYQLFAADGASLFRSPALGSIGLPKQYGTVEAPAYWNLRLPDGRPGRAVGIRFLAKNPAKIKKPEATEPEGKDKEKSSAREAKPPPEPVEVGLVLADHRQALETELNRLALILLGSGALTLLATLLLVPRILSRSLAPLNQLANHVKQLNASSLNNSFSTANQPAELAPIAARLNDLLSRLQTSFQRERQFSADLAHEIRTPIAGLQTTAEVALRYPDGNNAEALQTTLALARQMESTMSRILALARAEQSAVPVEKRPVKVAALVHEIWQTLAPVAQDRQIRGRLELIEQAQLETDPVLLRGLLSNLLANAVEYSPPASQVKVALVQNNGSLVMTVENPAPDLQAEDLPHLFERFWRKNLARNDSEHAGLGLALAKSYAELLDLDLTATLNPAGTVRFRLESDVTCSSRPHAQRS